MKETKTKKGLPTIAKVGFGCLIIFIILAVVFGLLANLVFKKVVESSIQNKTGIQTNLTDLKQGKFSFTDPKTGAKLDIGGNKIPDDFPKDFPIYPGSKVALATSGNQQQEGSGFWLTLTTADSLDKVQKYYIDNLKTNGWTINQTTTDAENGINMVVMKDKLSGFFTIGRTKDEPLTTITIVLGASTKP